MDHKLRGLDREGELSWREIQRRGLEDDYITSGDVQGPPDLNEALCDCGRPIKWTDCHHCTNCVQMLIDVMPEQEMQYRKVWMWSNDRRIESSVDEPCPVCKGPH